MTKKVKQFNSNPYDILRQLAGATHIEVQYFLPYITAWLSNNDDPMMADMDSVAIALLSYSLNGQLFAPGEKIYKQ